MDVSDPDTMYFYIIPGKKQFVKRLIGKPGDTLYFYGGRIYGIDSEGHDLTELRDSAWIQPLEHIPFIRFDGKPETSTVPNQGIFSPVVFNQMNEPIARLTFQDFGKINSEMLAPVKNYFDLWGFKNFAMARLLTPAELKQLYNNQSKELQPAPLYLELTHHPSLAHAALARDEYRGCGPIFRQASRSLRSIRIKSISADAPYDHLPFQCEGWIRHPLRLIFFFHDISSRMSKMSRTGLTKFRMEKPTVFIGAASPSGYPIIIRFCRPIPSMCSFYSISESRWILILPRQSIGTVFSFAICLFSRS